MTLGGAHHLWQQLPTEPLLLHPLLHRRWGHQLPPHQAAAQECMHQPAIHLAAEAMVMIDPPGQPHTLVSHNDVPVILTQYMHTHLVADVAVMSRALNVLYSNMNVSTLRLIRGPEDLPVLKMVRPVHPPPHSGCCGLCAANLRHCHHRAVGMNTAQ